MPHFIVSDAIFAEKESEFVRGGGGPIPERLRKEMANRFSARNYSLLISKDALDQFLNNMDQITGNMLPAGGYKKGIRVYLGRDANRKYHAAITGMLYKPADLTDPSTDPVNYHKSDLERSFFGVFGFFAVSPDGFHDRNGYAACKKMIENRDLPGDKTAAVFYAMDRLTAFMTSRIGTIDSLEITFGRLRGNELTVIFRFLDANGTSLPGLMNVSTSSETMMTMVDGDAFDTGDIYPPGPSEPSLP